MSRILSLLALMSLLCGLTACGEKEPEKGGEASVAKRAEQLPQLSPPELLTGLTIAPMDGKAVMLRYKPQAIGRHRVRLTQESSQERAGRKMDIGTQQTFVLNRELQEEGKDGWTTRLTITDLVVEPSKESKDEAMAGAMEALKNALQTVEMAVKQSPQGAVLDLQVMGGGTNRWQGMKQVMEQLVKDSIVELPEQGVAPGDDWPMSRESLLKTRKTANKIVYELNSKFLGYAQGLEGCTRCAVVHTEGTYTVTGTVTTPGMEGTSSGRGRAASVVVLDLDAGRLVLSETASALRQTFVLKGKDGDLEFSEEQRNRLVQEWLRPPEKSASGRSEIGEAEVK